jgi:hypothetical protein
MKAQCAWCDAEVPLMARACPECGAVNPARRTVFGAAATAAVLVPAIAIAVYAATRWDRPLIPGDSPAELALPSQPVAGSDADFAWLSAAMKACDDKAAAEPNTLHVLVIPVAFDPKDLEQWRRRALNRIGNAMVLSSEDTLAGLRSKALSIAPGEYTFSVRDEKTQAVRKWERATGVKWFSAPEGENVASIKMQYRPRDQGRDDSWGNPLAHQKGNCYWVNATFEE